MCFYVELSVFVIICLMSHRFDVCNSEDHHGVLPERVEVRCVVSVLQVEQHFTELNTHLWYTHKLMSHYDICKSFRH